MYLATFVCAGNQSAIKLLVESGVKWDAQIYTDMWEATQSAGGQKLILMLKWKKRNRAHLDSLTQYMKDNKMDGW